VQLNHQSLGEMMAISIESKGIKIGLANDREALSLLSLTFNDTILKNLEDNGYVPLISKAKQSFLDVLGANAKQEMIEDFSELNLSIRQFKGRVLISLNRRSECH
jgi:hypothetical protein